MRLLSLLLVLPLIIHTQAQDCNNPLLAAFNLTALPAPAPGTGLPYCQGLQNAQTCCSPLTVTNFQAVSSAQSVRLQNFAAARDVYIAQLQANYSAQFQNATNILEGYASVIAAIDANNSLIGDELSGQAAIFSNISDELANNSATFNDSLVNYQQTRAQCFLILLQVQASAYCLACDPNWAAQGVMGDGQIIYSDGLCSVISQACYPYLTAGTVENPLFLAKQAYQRVLNINDYLAEFQRTNIIPDTIKTNDIFVSANATGASLGIPALCTSATDCPWQCENLFINGTQINETLAGNGAGVLNGANIEYQPVGVNLAAPALGSTNDNADNASNTVTNTTSTVTNTTDAAADQIVTSVVTTVANTTGNAADAATDAAADAAAAATAIPAPTPAPEVAPAVPVPNPNTTVWAPDLSLTGIIYSVYIDPANLTNIDTFVGTSGTAVSGTNTSDTAPAVNPNDVLDAPGSTGGAGPTSL